MNIKKINALIEEHECKIDLRRLVGTELLAAYSYKWDEETYCKFTLLSEVAESLQDAFFRLLRIRGLMQVGTRFTTDKPFYQDILRPDPTTPAGRRWGSLVPDGDPRWVRVCDNDETADRYTVVFTGKAATVRIPGYPSQHPYLGMGPTPFHPQGVCVSGHTDNSPCDTKDGKWPPAVGRRNHLGKRILFGDLPADCQKAAFEDYLDIWRL